MDGYRQMPIAKEVTWGHQVDQCPPPFFPNKIATEVILESFRCSWKPSSE